MAQRSNDSEHPLPREWLPDAIAPEDAPEWELALQRIVAAAEPELRQLASGSSERDLSWATVLGSWWKLAGSLGAAAVVLLLAVGRPGTRADSGALPLRVVAAAGEPFALWESLGIEADPVLALIALQERAP
jgi:hypothetical protein